MEFMHKIQKFMCGRYARKDALYSFLFWIYIILFVMDLFVNNSILSIIQIVIIFTIIYRLFSKNIYKRCDENQKFLRFVNKVTKPLKNIRRNIKDKNHIYKKCKKCKTILKLPVPSERGIKMAMCPCCKNKVRVLVLKKENIEIIKYK